jgi:capsule polysaccharide export protein KpsC/LpsZ
MIEYHRDNNIDFTVDERPLWQFTPDNINQEQYDVIYVPHKEQHNFPLPTGKARYYMQTVFPEMFTVDTNGWGSHLSYLPLQLMDKPTYQQQENFELLKTRITRNVSKFDQPSSAEPIYSDILFVCQLPHDETIKFHSSVSVEKALETTLQWATKHLHGSNTVVVKGHPVNPGSMEPLRRIIAQSEFGYATRYLDNVSIHDCLRGTKLVVMVNSGVGFEAMLHEKPIVIFGNAEYSSVVSQALPSIESFNKARQQALYGKKHYVEWLNKFMQSAYDSRDVLTFEKLYDKQRTK